MKELKKIGNGMVNEYGLKGWEITGETEKAYQFSRKNTQSPIRPVWIPKKAVEGVCNGEYKIAAWFVEKGNDYKGLKSYPAEMISIF